VVVGALQEIPVAAVQAAVAQVGLELAVGFQYPQEVLLP
jgi:hypothetical protein